MMLSHIPFGASTPPLARLRSARTEGARRFPAHPERSAAKSKGQFAMPRRVWRISMAALTCLMTSTTLAHAHGGGGGPEVVLPPIFTSGLLGFVCYWLVILWPSSTKKSDTEVQSGTQSGNTTATRRASHQYSTRVKQKPRLRKIERKGRFGNDGNSGRKAHDG